MNTKKLFLITFFGFLFQLSPLIAMRPIVLNLPLKQMAVPEHTIYYLDTRADIAIDTKSLIMLLWQAHTQIEQIQSMPSPKWDINPEPHNELVEKIKETIKRMSLPTITSITPKDLYYRILIYIHHVDAPYDQGCYKLPPFRAPVYSEKIEYPVLLNDHSSYKLALLGWRFEKVTRYNWTLNKNEEITLPIVSLKDFSAAGEISSVHPEDVEEMFLKMWRKSSL